jgi:tRNA isopentenyl-2-thiomethyl-A-37 hydroxylase MiaE
LKRAYDLLVGKKKYASQADPELLEQMRLIAREQGRQFQAVMEDAMRRYVEQVRGAEPRDRVLAHFRASVERNRRLGELLAK